MTSTAIALVLLSALLHAVWNFFGKGSNDRWAFFFAQSLVMVFLYAPLLLWRWPRGGIPAAGWLWIAASAVTHGAYAFYLLKAYDAGDLSVAYPLSRTAPLLLAIWDLLTAPGALKAGGVACALLAGIGALTLQVPALRARGVRAVLADRVTRYSLITAVFIAVFTVIDKQGVTEVEPLVFMFLIIAGEFLLVGWQLGRTAPARIARELRGNGRAVVFTAIMGPFSYLLILWVLASAPASYVLGLRQTSIVFGVLLGHFLLREAETRYRLAGAVIIAGGSILIAAAG